MHRLAETDILSVVVEFDRKEFVGGNLLSSSFPI
jgi:hypothetical protein